MMSWKPKQETGNITKCIELNLRDTVKMAQDCDECRKIVFEPNGL